MDRRVQCGDAQRFPELLRQFGILALAVGMALGALAEAAEFWRGEGRPLWALIGGPDGWKSGWPDMPLK